MAARWAVMALAALVLTLFDTYRGFPRRKRYVGSCFRALRGGVGGVKGARYGGAKKVVEKSDDENDKDVPSDYDDEEILKDPEGRALPVVNGILDTSTIDVMQITHTLKRKDISTIPLGAFDDFMTFHLDLSENDLSEILDYYFRDTPFLRELDFHGNSITFVSKDAFSRLPLLSGLDLSKNRIETLDPSIFQSVPLLKSLQLSDNELRCIPDGLFRNLTRLEMLSINGNKITKLDPDVFRDLKNLRVLELSNMNLTSLPETIFESLENLMVLSLDKNSIKKLPEKIFSKLSNLRTIFLQDNNLTSLPDNIFSNLTKLRLIHLECNNVTSLPKTLFRGLPDLQRVYLLENPAMGFEERTYWGGTRKNLECMGVRYFNGTYPGIPEGFFDEMPDISRWACRFWTVNDGYPRSAEYILNIKSKGLKDKSPFEAVFDDPDEKEELSMVDLAAKKAMSEASNRERKIAELEAKLVAAREQMRGMNQDMTKMKQQLIGAGIEPKLSDK